MQRTDTGKAPDAGNDWRQERKGTTEDEMVGLYHGLNRHEFEQALGVGDGQGSLACCIGLQRIGYYWVTELNWTDTTSFDICMYCKMVIGLQRIGYYWVTELNWTDTTSFDICMYCKMVIT